MNGDKRRGSRGWGIPGGRCPRSRGGRRGSLIIHLPKDEHEEGHDHQCQQAHEAFVPRHLPGEPHQVTLGTVDLRLQRPEIFVDLLDFLPLLLQRFRNRRADLFGRSEDDSGPPEDF